MYVHLCSSARVQLRTCLREYLRPFVRLQLRGCASMQVLCIGLENLSTWMHRMSNQSWLCYMYKCLNPFVYNSISQLVLHYTELEIKQS